MCLLHVLYYMMMMVMMMTKMNVNIHILYERGFRLLSYHKLC